MRERKRVVVIGDVLMDNQYYIDKLPKAGQDIKVNSYAKNTGGSAANTAAKLASFELSACLVSCVGDDEDGRTFIKTLNGKGVDTSFISRQGQTGFTVTLIDSEGERTMLSSRGASAKAPELTPELREIIKQADLLLISGYWMQNEEQIKFVTDAATAAKTGAGLVAFDPCPIVETVDQPSLWLFLRLVDILLPNEAEYEFLKQNQRIQDVQYIAVKMGSRGAKLIYNGREYVQSAAEVQAVDTTGAGDAFNAGFLAAMLKGVKPQEWLKTGNECAAVVVGRKGAV